MGTDFTGGDFAAARAEAAKLRADLARMRTVASEAVTDASAQKALAARAQTAQRTLITETEAATARGVTAATAGGEANLPRLVEQRGAMEQLSVASQRALAPIQAMRTVGPQAFAQTTRSADQLAASLSRIRTIGLGVSPAASRGGIGSAPFFLGPEGVRGVPYPLPSEPPPPTVAPSPVGTVFPRVVTPPPGAVPPPVVVPTSTRLQPPTPVAQTTEAAAVRTTTTAINAESIAVSDDATAHAVLNAQMTRHGALSSEFIQQLARGNVSLREFGQQLVITGGKFGGWLAAGAGIFAVIGTVSALTKGAIDASSGVDQLKRVITNLNPDTAQAGFRQLSEEFNIPIADVSETVFQMGKAFHDQSDAFTAARSSLAAMKIGELDVATATRYLISIVNAYKLSADDMATVNDQITRGSKRFAVSQADIYQGVAKASGSFKQAGGDYTHLISLITALAHVSGQTGNVIGTAILRSPTQYRSPEHSATLKQYGIDVTQGIEDVYAQAEKAAQGKSPQVQQQIENALFGTQYGGRIGSFLLNNKKLVEQVYSDIANNSQGEAGRQVSDVLQKPTEQIKALGIELGALGSNLASAGLFDLLGTALHLLNGMLRAVNGLFEAFNSLPAPLRHVLSLMAELYGLFRLLRRFNIGSTLPGAVGQTFTNPRNTINARSEGLETTRTELSGQLLTASSQVTQAQAERAILQERLNQGLEAEGQSIKRGTQLSRASVGAVNEAVTAQGRIEEADKAIYDAQLRKAAIAKLLDQVTEEQSGLRETSTPVGPSGTLFQQAAANLRSNMQEFGAVGGVVGSAVDGVRAGATRMRSSIGRINWSSAASGLRGAATGIKSVASGVLGMIGPLDIMFLGLFALGQALGQSQQKLADANKLISTVPTSAAGVQANADQIQASANQGETLFQSITDDFTGATDAANAAIAVNEKQKADIANFQQAIEILGRGGNLTPQERKAYNTGTFQDVYEAAATNIRKRLAQHVIDLKTANNMLDALEKSAKTSPYVQDPTTLVQQIRQTGTGDQAQADVQTLQAKADITAAHGPLYNDLAKAQGTLSGALQVLATLKKEGASSSEILTARVDVAKAKQSLQSAANDEVKSLADATGQVKVSQLNPEATVARAHAAVTNARKDLQILRTQDRSTSDIKTQIAAVNDAVNAYQQALRERLLALVDITERETVAQGPLYSTTAEPTAQLDAARRKLEILKQRGGTNQQIADAQATVDEANRAVLLAQNDQAQSIADAAGQVATARIDPQHTVAVARQAAQNARKLYDLAVAQGRDQGTIMTDYATMLTAEQAFNTAVKQNAEDIAHARFAILTARAQAQGDDVRAAAIAARSALYDIHHADTQKERLTAQADLINAGAAKRQAIFQTEIDDIQFRTDIGKITLAQEISQYEQMLHTMQLTRDQRRELRQKIYELQHDTSGADSSSLDLALGDITLPTIYEIRRAIKGHGFDSKNPVVNQTNKININVKDAKDAPKVGRQLDKTINGGAQNAMRSAGLV